MAPSTSHATGTLAVPGARLHHEVRGAGPLVVLLGTPMGAGAFAPLADLLAVDHTVLTTDTRGTGRSAVDDRDATPSIETRADDVARLIAHVGDRGGDRGDATGPVAVLGSSGAAVTALGLAQYRPGVADTVIAHEPPLTELLPDRDAHRASRAETVRLWFAGDHEGHWRSFLAGANIRMPEEVFQTVFGGEPDAAAQADGDYQNGRLIGPSCEFPPDVAALRDGPTRVVVGLGEASADQVCDRTSRALADLLGTAPTMFPGGHIGMVDDPAAFEPRLRAVLPSA